MIFVILALSGTALFQYIVWLIGNRTAPIDNSKAIRRDRKMSVPAEIEE